MICWISIISRILKPCSSAGEETEAAACLGTSFPGGPFGAPDLNVLQATTAYNASLRWPQDPPPPQRAYFCRLDRGFLARSAAAAAHFGRPAVPDAAQLWLQAALIPRRGQPNNPYSATCQRPKERRMKSECKLHCYRQGYRSSVSAGCLTGCGSFATAAHSASRRRACLASLAAQTWRCSALGPWTTC